MLQCVAVYLKAFFPFLFAFGTNRCVAICCNLLQNAVECCSVMPSGIVCCSCCSVLQCVAFDQAVCVRKVSYTCPYQSVLQCATMCCSALRCVAVWYGVL